jgi:hypothetical protein
MSALTAGRTSTSGSAPMVSVAREEAFGRRDLHRLSRARAQEARDRVERAGRTDAELGGGACGDVLAARRHRTRMDARRDGSEPERLRIKLDEERRPRLDDPTAAPAPALDNDGAPGLERELRAERFIRVIEELHRHAERVARRREARPARLDEERRRELRPPLGRAVRVAVDDDGHDAHRAAEVGHC